MGMRTLDDLVEHSGMSKSYWYKRTASRSMFFTRFGGKIRFTEEQWAATLAAFAVGPKVVPTRDEVAARRAAAASKSSARRRTA